MWFIVQLLHIYHDGGVWISLAKLIKCGWSIVYLDTTAKHYRIIATTLPYIQSMYGLVQTIFRYV